MSISPDPCDENLVEFAEEYAECVRTHLKAHLTHEGKPGQNLESRYTEGMTLEEANVIIKNDPGHQEYNVRIHLKHHLTNEETLGQNLESHYTKGMTMDAADAVIRKYNAN